MKNYRWIIGIALIFILPSLGLKEKENVDQGRVIQFDKGKGIVKVVLNKNADHLSPEYNSLPPMTYTLPAASQAIGFIPKVGLRLNLDTKHKEIVVFDEANQKIKTLIYTLIDQKENIAKNNPLILENGDLKKFPLIDREKNLITIYSERQRILTTFTLPAEYFSLPDYTWEAGNEVLIHYKEDGKTRRVTKIAKIGLMNGK
jgi:hypothetical protein